MAPALPLGESVSLPLPNVLLSFGIPIWNKLAGNLSTQTIVIKALHLKGHTSLDYMPLFTLYFSNSDSYRQLHIVQTAEYVLRHLISFTKYTFFVSTDFVQLQIKQSTLLFVEPFSLTMKFPQCCQCMNKGKEFLVKIHASKRNRG